MVGSFSGSLRMRSSIGSIPSSAASSSMALSRAKVPTASPGARMKVLAIMLSFTVSTSSLKLLAAYRLRVATMKGSVIALWGVIAVRPV
jgi:hypothetical protein